MSSTNMPDRAVDGAQAATVTAAQSAAQIAARTANRAAGHPVLDRFTRAGFLGYGLIHLLVAWLALQVAFGHSAAENDQYGALRTLAGRSWGAVAVGAIGVGLLAMALWQGLEAAVGHREERGRARAAERIASAGRAVVYLYLAGTAYKVLSGAATSSADRQQQTSADLMGHGGGRWLVGLAGVALAGVGAGLAGYGLAAKFEKRLHIGRMSARVRRVVRWLGRVGYAGKGVAYGIAGVLLVVAAVTYDPAKARGLDAALRTLAGQPYGCWLLSAVALGIGAFAAYCVAQARYRKV